MLRPDEDALGNSDLVLAEARARPAAYILQAKLPNPFFRFSPADFTGWFCFQFRFPQAAHLGNANAAGVEQCLGSCRRRDIDLHGNHAHAPCTVRKLGRGHRHRYLKKVVRHHAAKASCLVSRVVYRICHGVRPTAKKEWNGAWGAISDLQHDSLNGPTTASGAGWHKYVLHKDQAHFVGIVSRWHELVELTHHYCRCPFLTISHGRISHGGPYLIRRPEVVR
jgi:hypothetical protein